MLKRYDAPPDAPPPRAMVRRDLWNERRVPLDLARLCLALAAPSRPPIGSGMPVVLVPGWRFGEASVEPLRRYLARRGFRAQHWGNGVNRGKVERDTRRLLDTTRAVAAGAGQPVNLVGWSLGGVVAREVARIAPDAVRAVFTYGTPVIGGPKYTLAARIHTDNDVSGPGPGDYISHSVQNNAPAFSLGAKLKVTHLM